jgi:ribosome-binding factor A
MLRTEVGKNITARLTPSLEFILDGLPENASAIADLLREANERDAETGRQAQSARFAGDADPYKSVPGDEEPSSTAR